jgi:uncharacterized Ntn-hydrolase superfamily protein
MTFSITAYDPSTGQFGVALCTRALSVGARCPFGKPGVGMCTTQASTDPRLGPLGVRLLELGFSAPKVIQELRASDPYIEHRQLAVVDRDGRGAAYTGTSNNDWAGHHIGDHYVAMGNYLVSERTVSAMVQAYESSADQELAERLVRAIEAGRDAGGQHEGQHSAALLVYYRDEFAYYDVRTDEHPEPAGELRRLFEKLQPLAPYFSRRAADPTFMSEHDWLAQRSATASR